MKASVWIDRVKAAKGIESDYATAKKLGLTRAAVSNYRVGARQTLDDEASLKVSDALGVDPIIILADQAMERAKSDTARSAWAGILVKLGISQEKAPELESTGAEDSWRKRRDSNPR